MQPILLSQTTGMSTKGKYHWSLRVWSVVLKNIFLCPGNLCILSISCLSGTIRYKRHESKNLIPLTFIWNVTGSFDSQRTDTYSKKSNTEMLQWVYRNSTIIIHANQLLKKPTNYQTLINALSCGVQYLSMHHNTSDNPERNVSNLKAQYAYVTNMKVTANLA